MKKLICTIVFVFLTVFTAWEVRAEKLEIGAKFDVNKLSTVKKSADNTIIAFVPSLTYDCDYASMLTQSFYFYFDQRLAFEGLKKSPVTRIFLVVADKQNEARSLQNIRGGMEVVYDETGAIFSQFGVKYPFVKNADSTIVLLDSNEKIALIDENYRAQGEHLKPLENKIRELNGIVVKANVASIPKPLKVGDRAPDFLIRDNLKLSDLRNQVVLVSFYPAAFSGTFPKPPEIVRTARPAVAPSTGPVKQDQHGTFTEVVAFDAPGPWQAKAADIMSCSFQLTMIDVRSTAKRSPVQRVVVSSSTAPLLEQWRQALGTRNIVYANDPDYSISKQYFSYNPTGYNNRVSVIIDQKGRIAYIDESFEASDEKALEAKIEELIAKK